jgi:phage baseplate assembly protein W
MPIGLTLPFARTTSSLGALDFSVTEEQATLYNMKSLLLTNWGERPMHYNLGCNLVEYLFAPADDETIDQIKSRIYEQVQLWLSYVELVSVDVAFDGEHRLSLRVEFRLRGRQNKNSVIQLTVSP